MMKYINKQRIVIAVIVLIIAVIFFIFHSKSKDNSHIIPGYIEANLSEASDLEIEIQGKKRKAKILDKVVYDPENKKLRS